MADQRLAAPIHGDEGEQAVLDFVPFAGARRQVSHRHRQPCLVGKSLQLTLPEPELNPVAAARVAGQLQPLGPTQSRPRPPPGAALGGSSRLFFLKSPTSSFFFVSTEIAGSPAAIAAFTVALTWANCASRSGWLLPSWVLRLPWQLYCNVRSRFATTRWLALNPSPASA